MKYNIKKEIAKAFSPPKPKGRDSFLAGLTYPRLTYPEFILSQVCYIRKRVWLASAAVLLSAVGTVGVLPESGMTVVWVISAVIPFWAVLTAAEISRSNIFGMSEIEAGCRFALPQSRVQFVFFRDRRCDCCSGDIFPLWDSKICLVYPHALCSGERYFPCCL